MKMNQSMVRRLGWLVAISILLLAGLYNQPNYPKTWFDEGLALQGAINLAEHGQYAMRSSEGLRILDQPLIANGPGLVLPLALLFRFFGVGLLQARILMGVCFTLAVLLFHKAASKLFEPVAVLISVFILLAIPTEGFIMYGRQALGNVPAFLYFLAGILFLQRTAEHLSVRDAFLSGMFFGLALVTKGQYWIIFPALGITWVADRYFYGRMGSGNGLIIILTTIGCLLLWQGAQFLLVGPQHYIEHVMGISLSARVSVFAFRTDRIPGNIWYLMRSGFPLFIMPGLIAAGWAARRRTTAGLLQFFLLVFVLSWLVWYVFASVGWTRYAFEAYAAGSLLAGEGMLQLVKITRAPVAGGLRYLFSLRVVRFTSFVLLSALVLLGVQGLLKQVAFMASPPYASPLEFSNYLRGNVPTTDLIESWEWELDILAPEHTFHHPDNVWVDRKTAELQFGEPLEGRYEPLSYDPEYLIDGPFSKLTEMYSEAISSGCCTAVVTMGEYTLYRVGDGVSRGD